MIFHNSYNLLLNSLRLGYLYKRQYIQSCYNIKILRLLTKLIQIRYISRYEILDNKQLRIYLVYDVNGLPNFKYTKLLYKPSYRIIISYRRLHILYKYDFGIIYILSTPKGFLTHSEAIKLKCGGELICVLYS